jgi:hypothetical protein
MFSGELANSRLTPLILASPPDFGQELTIVSQDPAIPRLPALTDNAHVDVWEF